MKPQAAWVAICAVMISSTSVLGADRKVGDPAPPLKIKKWVKGDKVDVTSKDGKVYVVEFWATWCGPCIRGIPHLTELQQKYKDKLVIVSVTSGDEQQDLKDVQRFVKRMGDRMGYTIAYDDGDKTDKAYMKAFDKRGIPQAFVIDRHGKIVWEGHPMFGLDAVVDTVINEDYTVDKLATIAKKAAEKKMEELQRQTEMMQRYFGLVSMAGESKQATELGQKLYEMIRDDAFSLNGFAWTILDQEGLKWRDLDLAIKAAQRANKLTDGNDPSILDTYARALFETGQIEQAIEHQKKALKILGKDSKQAEPYAEVLKRYLEAARDAGRV